MYSRRQTIEERENKRKAFGFILLTIASLAFIIIFGLPLLARISNFAYDMKKSGEPVESSDKTPPPPPRFNNLPDYTKDNKLEIRGYTEPGATVKLQLNNDKIEFLADNDGNFTHTINLNDGENTLEGISQDSSGNKSQTSQIYRIVLDKTAPELVINSPKDGDEFYGSRQKNIKVSGHTEKNSEVQINDRFVVVDSEGNFTFSASLSDGENKFNIKSQDKAGNVTETTITVKFTS